MSGSASATAADWQGTERYEVLGRLGQGGMGVVYEAFDRERGQRVAVKKLLRFDPAALYLFKQEFRTLADVRHTNLVHLYELVVDPGGEVFFTMELVAGSDFRQYARRAGAGDEAAPDAAPSPAARVPTVPGRPDRETVRPAAPKRADPSPADLGRLRPALRQLVEGIHALHGAGKLHRDVKPSNVMVTPEGRVVLLDFGVATELRGPAGEAPSGSGEIVGTARYMAPEQVDDEAPVPASDWYSVGVMLYEALVGRTPFVGSTVDMLTMKSTVDALAPSECVSGVPTDLDALCVALLQRDPDARPHGAEILRRLGVARSSAPPAAMADRTAAAFIGREPHLQALRAAYEEARAAPVTVRVGGASGMGKSTLVHRFLDGLATDRGAIVLRGRAYERETVPYKAVDTVVDALSRHLLRVMEGDGAALALPPDTWLLARLFPVLQRVPAIAELPPLPVDDPQNVRRRAFAALRDVLGLLAASQPVVLFVDDAQWGDVDSAALLLQLLAPPGAPGVLLVMTYRDDEERTSAFLSELRTRWPARADLRELEVLPLQQEDSIALAMTLLGTDDDTAKRTARAVARESRGSPFLIEELSRTNRGLASASGATLAVLTLDQMIAERLARLSEAARRLVEIIAVGGRPMPVSAVGVAAEHDAVNEAVGYLSARRFVRTGLRGGHDVVEMKHDRIRETVVAQLSTATLRAYHGRLAQALQDSPGADAQAVAMHWLGAGDTERAARFAEGAAEQAAAKLAFDQAARLYRLALDNLPASVADDARLRARLGEVLRLAGRSQDAARAFLAAAERSEPARRLELQRAAAEQLLFSGRIDEGTTILHRVLAAVGMSAPRTPLTAVLWLIVYRLWLRFLGLRVTERGPGDVTPERRLRVDALATVAHCFAVVDVIRGACMQARHLVEALRYGDRFQVARAMGLEGGHIAAAGGPETDRERVLFRTAEALAAKEGSAEARAFFAASLGVGLFNRGRPREAQPLLEEATRYSSVYGGLEVARMFDVYAVQQVGRLAAASERVDKVCALAEDRGDLYALVNMRTTVSVTRSLRDDDPERARRELDQALAQWSQAGFHVQHWQAMVYRPSIDHYVGEFEEPYQRFIATMPALRRSHLLHAGFIRMETYFVWGKLALATLEATPALRDARVAEGREMARKLSREDGPWAKSFARLLEAMVANATGQRAAAIRALRSAIAAMEADGILLCIDAVRYRLGELLADDEGRTLMRDAIDALTAQGFRAPDRFIRTSVPGRWSKES